MNIINWDKVATVTLALWGATLSTILYLKDRPKIKVSLSRGFITTPPFSNILICSISNSGRRPINVTNFSFETNQKDKVISFVYPSNYVENTIPNFPFRVEENSNIDIKIFYEPILKGIQRKQYQN